MVKLCGQIVVIVRWLEKLTATFWRRRNMAEDQLAHISVA